MTTHPANEATTILNRIEQQSTSTTDALAMILCHCSDMANHNGLLLSVARFEMAAELIAAYFERRTALSEHEAIDTIWRKLKADGWQAIGNGRWKSPDGRVFDPHAAVLLPAWRVWRDTGKVVTTGERLMASPPPR